MFYVNLKMNHVRLGKLKIFLLVYLKKKKNLSLYSSIYPEIVLIENRCID
jgi:hypothetical protein